MPEPPTDIQARLHALQQQFQAGLSARLQQITQAGENWLDAPIKTAESDFQLLVHNLAGAAGSYGFTEITTLCQQIEDAIRDNTTASENIIRSRLEELQAFIGSRQY